MVWRMVIDHGTTQQFVNITDWSEAVQWGKTLRGLKTPYYIEDYYGIRCVTYRGQ